MKKNGFHINKSGTKCWYKDGLAHRDDGPAIIYRDGAQHWYKNGVCHRDYGPASIYCDGSQAWYKEGEEYEPSAHDLMVYKMHEKERITH